MLLFILISMIITLCLLLWALSSPFYWKRKGVPYLFPLPLFGNNLPLLRMSLPDFYKQLYNNYPNDKYFGVHLFTRPTLLLKDPLLIKEICIKDFEYFSSSGMYSNQDNDPFGGNLLFLHGQQWKEIRTKLSTHFTPAKLRIVNDYVENTMKKVNKLIKEKINNKDPIQIEKLTVSIAIDVVVQAVFGIETDCFQEKSQFYAFAEKMLSNKTNMRLLLGIILPELNDLLKINILDKEVTSFLENILREVIKYRENNNVIKQDFVNAMMNMMKMEKNSKNKEKYFPDKTRIPEYNFKTVLSQALILMSGGMESSAMTMAFFLYEASLNQDIQDKCREEIMAIVNETGTDVRPEDVSKLKYLNMSLKETLRKYPPFIILTRKCTKSYNVRDTNLTIDPGTLVLMPIKSIQSDPNNYPNPEAFIPERFSPENKTSIDAGAFITWGLGPRACIGKSFAKLEMNLVISRLLRRYRFTLASKTKVPVDVYPYKTVTTPNPGIWLDIEPLNN